MTHDFHERLAFSEGVELEEGIFRTMRDMIPLATRVVKATRDEDRAGTDYWIERPPLPPVSVDVKHTSFDPVERFGCDNACIEVVSVYDGPERKAPWNPAHFRKPGWTVDPTKRTDLVLYTWPALENRRRFWVLYFPHLCAAARRNVAAWGETYGLKAAHNVGYLTLACHPPRTAIAAAIRELTVGVTNDPEKAAPANTTPAYLWDQTVLPWARRNAP